MNRAREQRASVWGKLPAHGDFVARGLAADARDALDTWLAGSLANARTMLGGGFDDAYDRAPPWRFARRDGDGWTAGAIAPSVDGVGRRYPILAALGGLDAFVVAPAGAAIEALLYDALAEGWDADALVAAVADVNLASTDAWTGGDRWWTLGGEGFAETGVAGARPPLLMRAILTVDDRREGGA